MTLKQIIGTIKNLAKKHPNVNSTYEGNIYDILNANPSNKYASVVLTQTTHTQDEMFDHYGFVIFYVDRLIDDVEDNRVQIQSIGKSMLTNIVEAFCYEFDAEHNDITFHPFTQKFADETAGVYIDIVIDTPKDSICAERYWDEQWSAPIITIKNATEQIHITDNGRFEVTYDPTNYTGLEKVIIDVEFDTNPYYAEGYNNGYEEGGEQGYNNGFANGADDQKNKLESITITENGSYSREDGYNEVIVDVPDTNGSYDEGYSDGYINGDGDGYHRGYVEGEANGVENAGEIIAQTAQVLNITENGEYKTRYSEPPIPDVITGVYSDGTVFSNYAQLTNKVFNTNIPATPTTRLEMWYKGDNTLVGDAYNVIIGAGKKDDANAYQIRYDSILNDRIRVELGFNILYHSWDENAWHHILIDKETEDASCMSMWIDEVKVGDFTNYSFNPQSTFYINGIEYDLGGQRRANGCFGMVKIDDQTFIPTADGFRNTNTGELLEVVKEGDYTFTDNPPIVPEGNLIKTVNVNVLPKINVAEAGINFGYSTFKEIPDFYDFSNNTNMRYMFYSCSSLQTIPLIDTSNVTDMYYTFRYCSSLQTIPLIDTSKVINMERAFSDCTSLQTIPSIDTSNVTNMNYMFYSCGQLATLPELDVSKVTNMGNYFRIGGGRLTDVGGWKNLKINWNDNYGLVLCPNLTYQSCINILNGLYDFTGNGETPSSNQGQLKVHQNFIDTVGDEISIAIEKGWQITV